MTEPLVAALVLGFGPIVLCACDVGVREKETGIDAGAFADGGAGDAGSRPDAGTFCNFVGCDCAALPCAPGLTCGADSICVETPVCVEPGGECWDDFSCCKPADPTSGVWCGTEGTCEECANAGSACTSDFGCCPPESNQAPLMCTSKGVCTPICRKDLDCATGETCMLSGECFPTACSGDDECPGERCCSGTCKPDCGYGPPEACAVTTPGGASFKDRTKKLHAIAWKGDVKKGAQLVPWTEFKWQSSRPDIVSVNETTGEATGGGVEGTATITAKAGELDCGRVALENYFPLETRADVRRVLVYDADSGLPVPDAAFLTGAGETAKTDEDGRAFLASPSTELHVFHAAYEWVSIIGVEVTDWIIHLTPRRDENTAGGFRGSFAEPPPKTGSGIHYGQACTSFAGDPLDAVFRGNSMSLWVPLFPFDFGPDTGCEEPFLTHIKFSTKDGAPLDYDDWHPIAGGNTIGFPLYGAPDLKKDYRVLGKPGPRVAWGTGVEMPRDFSKFFTTIVCIIGPCGGFGAPLSTLMSYNESLDQAAPLLLDVVPIPKIATPLAENGQPFVDDPLMADYENFPEINLEPAAKKSIPSFLTLPDLPSVGDRCVRGAYAEIQTRVPGLGAVSMGRAAGMDGEEDSVNGPFDCTVDKFEGNPRSHAEGELLLMSAPNHHGLEGNPRRLLTLAADFPTSVDAVSGRGEKTYAMSGFLNKIDRIERTYDLSGRPFMPFPEGAAYDNSTRTISPPPVAVPGASFYRYKVENEKGEWYVYAPDNGGPIVLPSVPAGLEDRATAAGMSVYAIEAGVLTLHDLVSTDGMVHLDDLIDQLTAFSRLTCLKKIAATDPGYAKKCEPVHDTPDEACNPACEVR